MIKLVFDKATQAFLEERLMLTMTLVSETKSFRVNHEVIHDLLVENISK